MVETRRTAEAGGEWRKSGFARRRWLAAAVPVIGLALLPKCLACVLGYIAIGAGLSAAGRELCGAVTSGDGWLAVLTSDGWLYGGLALAAGMTALVWGRRARK